MANGYRARLIAPAVAAVAFGLAFPLTSRAYFFVWPEMPGARPTTLIPDDTDATANPPSARSEAPGDQPPVDGPSGNQVGQEPVKVTERLPLVPEPTTGLVTAVGLGVLAAARVVRRARGRTV